LFDFYVLNQVAFFFSSTVLFYKSDSGVVLVEEIWWFLVETCNMFCPHMPYLQICVSLMLILKKIANNRKHRWKVLAVCNSLRFLHCN